jgi:TolA-binding protein
MTEPEPLADDLLEYLAAARETEPVSAALKERLLARLGPMLPPDGGGGSDGGGSPSDGGAGAEAAVTSATASILQSKVFVAAVAAVIGAAGGATGYATLAPPRTVITYMPAVAAPAPESAAPEPQPASIAPPPAVAVEPAAPSTSAPVPPPKTSSEAPARRNSTMRAERILLEAANAALLRGDHVAAIASLRKHERRYPKGELVQERDVLMAQAKKLSAGSTPR